MSQPRVEIETWYPWLGSSSGRRFGKKISAITIFHLPRHGALPLPTGDVSYKRVTATVQEKGHHLLSCSLDPLPSYLPPVQPNQPEIFHAV